MIRGTEYSVPQNAGLEVYAMYHHPGTQVSCNELIACHIILLRMVDGNSGRDDGKQEAIQGRDGPLGK